MYLEKLATEHERKRERKTCSKLLSFSVSSIPSQIPIPLSRTAGFDNNQQNGVTSLVLSTTCVPTWSVISPIMTSVPDVIAGSSGEPSGKRKREEHCFVCALPG